jgi:hypothetical protein
MSSGAPIMPFSTIIRVANMASRASVGLLWPCSMNRGHERDLDDDHRKAQHERAVRLAEFLGHRVGLAYDAEGAPQHYPEQQTNMKIVRG